MNKLDEKKTTYLSDRFIKAFFPQNEEALGLQTVISDKNSKDIYELRNLNLNLDLNYFRTKSQKELFEIHSSQIETAAKAINDKKTVLLRLVDEPANGKHEVLAVYDSDSHSLLIEIPDMPSEDERMKGFRGYFASVLHIEEAWAASYRLAMKQKNYSGKTLKSKKEKISLPILNFLPKNGEQSLMEKLKSIKLDQLIAVTFPFTYQPKTSYMLVFRPNARGDYIRHNGRAIARAHLEYVLADKELLNVLMRHTIVVKEKSSIHNNHFLEFILEDHKLDTFSLFDVNRISLEGEIEGLTIMTKLKSSDKKRKRLVKWSLPLPKNKVSEKCPTET